MNKTIIKERKNKVIYIEDDKCYKVFEEGYNVGHILNEALNQARVQDTDLNLPHLLGVNSFDNKWAIVMEKVDGKTIEELIEENPDKEDYYLNRFVDIQIDMHSKHCPLLMKMKDKANTKISRTSLPSTLRYDLHNRIVSMPNDIYLCHGDYVLSNVLIDNNDKAYIIDWSHATQGNREADVAKSYLLFLIEEKKELAKKYVDLYCAKTGCKIIDVLAWLPMLIASLSVHIKEDKNDLIRDLIYKDEKGLLDIYENL